MKNKPSNLKYTDLCIYIDNTVYNRDKNNIPISLREMTPIEQENVYNYLYNIISALTAKKKLLYTFQDIEEFSIEFAGNVFLRLTNKKQDFLDPDFKKKGKKRLAPVKSVLNYIKNVLPLIVVDYRKDNYKEMVNPEYVGWDSADSVRKYVEDSVRADYEKPKNQLIEEGFSHIIEHLDKILDKSIFKNNKIEKNNLRLSILLTLRNIFNTPNYLETKNRKKLIIIKSQVENWKQNIIIWGNSKVITKPLVILNIQKIFKSVMIEIDKEERETSLPEDTLKDILETAFSTYGLNQMEEE